MLDRFFRRAKQALKYLSRHTFIFFFLTSNMLTGSMISNAFSKEATSYPMIRNCVTDPNMQKARSKELAELVLADQKVRENMSFEKMTKDEIKNFTLKDLERRKRVGEIMAEGCITTAKDYAAAALIYQHGDVPDHYYQAFIWANRAVALGDVKQKSLVAVTIDRYLMSIGKKQLFGSQFQTSDKTGWCYCIAPIETSFPDSYRMHYLNKKLSEQYKFLNSLNEGKKNCHQTVCPMKLAASPRNSIPGFW